MVDAVFSQQWSNVTLIYSGRYYDVYRAMRMGRWFVLKCVRDGCERPSLHASLLVKEFDIGYNLNHRCVARALSIEAVDGIGQCLVMDYVEGDTLDVVLERGKLPARLALGIATDLCSALGYLHTHQIVHRDVKPQNIIVDQQRCHAVLIDFGLADTSSYALLKMPAGTRRYAAPECLKDGVTDSLSDIYSLGVVLEEIAGHAEGGNRRLLHSVASRCTREERSARPQCAEDVANLLAGGYRPVWRWVVAAAVVVALGIALWWMWPSKPSGTMDTVDTMDIEAPVDTPSAVADTVRTKTATGTSEQPVDHDEPMVANGVQPLPVKDYGELTARMKGFALQQLDVLQHEYLTAYIGGKRARGEEVDKRQEVAEHYCWHEIMGKMYRGDRQTVDDLHAIAVRAVGATARRLAAELPPDNWQYDSVMKWAVTPLYIGYGYQSQLENDLKAWKHTSRN